MNKDALRRAAEAVISAVERLSLRDFAEARQRSHNSYPLTVAWAELNDAVIALRAALASPALEHPQDETCPRCKGKGIIEWDCGLSEADCPIGIHEDKCLQCDGTGKVDGIPQPVSPAPLLPLTEEALERADRVYLEGDRETTVAWMARGMMAIPAEPAPLLEVLDAARELSNAIDDMRPDVTPEVLNAQAEMNRLYKLSMPNATASRIATDSPDATEPAPLLAQDERVPPHELWKRANGDRDEYMRLMREHGHIIPASEGGVRPHWAPPAQLVQPHPEGLDLLNAPTEQIADLVRQGRATIIPKRDPGGPLPTIKAQPQGG